MDGKCINEELVRAGLTWIYLQYRGDGRCAEWTRLREKAKEKRIGPWNRRNPLPPWEYRARHGPDRSSWGWGLATRLLGDYRGNESSRVFHRMGCKYYDCKELKQDPLLEYGLDPELALEWLPGHARINGLFERKVIRLHDGLKELADKYLALEKASSKDKSPRLTAKLFFRGMILCENQENLKFIKTIDLIMVRRKMKQANPDLFAEFLERIVEGKSPG